MRGRTRAFGASFRGLLGLFGLFSLVAAGACGGSECQPIGCGHSVAVNGSATFESEPTTVDLTTCVDQDCRSDSFDLGTLDASTPCLTQTQSPVLEVCRVADKMNTFEAHFRGALPVSTNERPASVRLELVARESGAVLVDESRTPKYATYYLGDCQFECWSAEVSL